MPVTGPIFSKAGNQSPSDPRGTPGGHFFGEAAVSLWRDTDILITQNGTGIALNFCQPAILGGPA